MDRYICIHGHFYQPPRENPWLEAVEVQDSAYPYHDWNERITAECYGPNAAARMLDGAGKIARLVNNYSRISFNFGPTLLSWLEKADRDVYRAIQEADRESRRLYSGHGSAMAQAYNHMIMPLANRRDKLTQVVWGIRDFQHRFGRAPEGMWLPETAVDLETLDIMAEHGIRFTILEPHQARQVRRLGGRTRVWRDLTGGRVDPSTAYEVHTPGGRTIAVFFYDGPISRGVAFERLLERGEDLANRLAGAFVGSRPWPQLVHIATDGETYGHHHRYGEMALAYALCHVEAHQLARLTNYGEYLERHPPQYEVEIIDNTSWSCMHGVERWRSDCGCTCGGPPPGSKHPWHQRWRTPLREALDWLRDALAPCYEAKAREFLKDPWGARNEYVEVVNDRSEASVERFFAAQAVRPLPAEERTQALKLLEMQRHAMLMYTSCGWFFNDISGIETVQVLQHAGRVLHLARQVVGGAFEPRFLEMLERAPSNVPEHQNGRQVFETLVRPAVVEWENVAAHHAVSSLFNTPAGHTHVYAFEVDSQDHHAVELGKARLVVGRVEVASTLTRESQAVAYGFLHLSDHNLFGGVSRGQDKAAYEAMVQEAGRQFGAADFPAAIYALDRHLGGLRYSVKSLSRDAQRWVLNHISRATLGQAEATYRQLFENHQPLLRFLIDLRVPFNVLSVPLPKALQTAAEFVVNMDLRRALEADEPDRERVRGLVQQAQAWHLGLDAAGLGYLTRQQVRHYAEQWRREPADLAALERLDEAVELARALPFDVDLVKAQNVAYEVLHGHAREERPLAETGDERARRWLRHFRAVCERLGIRGEG